jgi:hypothetical protein
MCRGFAAYTPLGVFQFLLWNMRWLHFYFIQDWLSSMFQCCLVGIMLYFYHAMGLRIHALEKKMEHLERHVVIDIESYHSS